MIQLLKKIVSTISFFLFFYFCLIYYFSENFKLQVQQTRKLHNSLISRYGMTLPKIEVDKNFKTFLDNTDYFKKIDKEPKFWELIK